MIKGKIYTRRKFKDKNGQEWTNFKIYYKGRGFWVSEIDFSEKLSELDDFLIIDGTVAVKKMKTKNGEFLKIIPKPENQEPANTAKEQAATYSTKKPEEEELKVYSVDEIIEEAKKSKQKNESQEPEKAKGTKSSKPAAKTSQQEVKDKTAFIKTLLDYTSNKNTDNKNRKKLHELISREIEKSRLSKEDVEKIVEEKLNYKTGTKTQQKQKYKKEIKLNEHRPKDVFQFLSLFRGTDHPLKYLIHDYTKPNSLFEIKTFVEKVEQAFIEETKKYSLPVFLKGRISAFIGINKDYKAWKFKDKWNSFSFKNQKVISWCDKNPAKHPIKKFYDDIDFFRASIIIDKNLPALINYALGATIYHQKIQIKFDENIQNASFLTDVDALITGLQGIFNSIGQQINEQSGNEVKISFKVMRTPENRFRIIEIVHVGSKCNKDLDENIFGGDLKSTKNSFYQLCDWSIIAKNTSKKHNKLNILYNPETTKQSKEKLDVDIEGFTHLITFYS